MAAPLQIPIFLWGDTGIGKTQIIEQVAALMEIPSITVIAQITTPVDWTGLPHIVQHGNKKMTEFSQPLYLPQEEIHGKRGIYFFDELPNATKSVQAAIQSLLTRGEYNGYLWPEGWKQVAAGNKLTHKANTFEMPRPVKNRLMHLYVGADESAWLEWAAGSNSSVISNPNLSFTSIKDLDGDAKNPSRIHPLIRAFIRSNPKVFTEDGSEGEAFPSPRAWHYVSHVMKLAIDARLSMIMIQGLVGPGPASELSIYLRDTSILPNPLDLLEKKDGIDLIKRTSSSGDPITILKNNGIEVELEASQLYALSCSLATAVDSAKQLKRFFQLLDAFYSHEYGVVAINEVKSRVPELTRSAAFVEWVEKVSDGIIR